MPLPRLYLIKENLKSAFMVIPKVIFKNDADVNKMCPFILEIYGLKCDWLIFFNEQVTILKHTPSVYLNIVKRFSCKLVVLFRVSIFCVQKQHPEQNSRSLCRGYQLNTVVPD